MWIRPLYLIFALTGCATAQSRAGMALVPAGAFVAGSDQEERERAYSDFERTSGGKDAARRGRWFEREEPRHEMELPRAVWLDVTLVTNADYARFVRAGGAPPPEISEDAWARQGFVQRWADQVARFNWTDGAPPAGRERHPVVLVTWAEADAYCRWRGARLPTAAELEKAIRGEDGRAYPWGDEWDPTKLNSHDGGPGDTTEVGAFANGSGPYGHHDVVGNVFQWTATDWKVAGQAVVKGGAWDDWGGVARGAQVHGRPKTIRHAIVGFRCAAD
jgi:formylglycine-generating enzyme required for sulfatase activity